jgi:ATP-binding cassette subfamily C (CFTR/MRP) protein 4
MTVQGIVPDVKSGGSVSKVAEVVEPVKSPADTRGIGAITFGYGLPMMRLGATRPLQASDLPPIRSCDQAQGVVDRIIVAWQTEQRIHPVAPSFMRALGRAFWWKLFVTGVWCFLESVSRIAQPICLKQYLRALELGDPGDLYFYAAVLVLASLAQAVIHHQLYFETMVMGWNMRIGVTGVLHWKLLRLRPHELQSSAADCYNLVSNDVQRFDQAIPALHFGWSAILDIFAVGGLLVMEVGWLASLCSISVVFLIAAIMTQFARRFAARRKITASITDSRMKLTSEVISAIMSVKVYCWESAFLQRIGDIRRSEHISIFKRMIMTAASSSMYFALTPAACLALFLLFVSQGNRLSVPVVYTSLSLLLALRLSIGKSFNRFTQMVPECLAAVSRFSVFLALPEMQTRGVELEDQAPGIEVHAASFVWPSGPAVLSGLDFRLQCGELLVVSGPVGCGKSALLQGLLGDLDVKQGAVSVRGSIGYAPQSPWIMAGTLRSNVTLDESFDDKWYREVIAACGLMQDIRQLGEAGDLTEIGERGTNLSGGQKARVGLARAVYAKPAIVLLDDPLAAVDPAVAAHLIKRCIRGEVLKSSVVVLCTHQESVFPLADKLLLLDQEGRPRACGPPKAVAAACGIALAEFAADSEASAEAVEPEVGCEEQGAGESQKSMPAQAVSLVRPEDKKQGSVGWQTFADFARFSGFGLTALVFVLFAFSQGFLLASNYWIGAWARAEDQSEPVYIWVFVALTAATIVLACARSILFYFATLRASSSLHSNALKHVIETQLSFFTANPLGRIMNRFSGDLGNVDELLSVALHEVFALGMIGLSTVIVVCITVPPVIPCFIVIFFYMARLRSFCVKSMTELKRLESVSKSPIFDCFNASLRGIACIRAFGRQETCQKRMVHFLDSNAQAWFWWLITNRFIGFRLDMQSTVIMAFAAFGGAALRDFVPAELLALAVVNTVSLSGLFQFMVRQSALVESFMTSFERLQAYTRLAGEPDCVGQAPLDFPSSGEIEVSELRMCYREDLPEVLKGVNFRCKSGIKVGICGRTGSGKSSIFMALARLAENTGGSVCIAGADCAELPLAALRGCIAWVPQEPNFFSGPLRLNLDPHGRHSDDELKSALAGVEMADALGKEGLDMQVAEGGGNFSIGERQLLSLARALVQRRKILCMDEAFANVDFATDLKVQLAIRRVTEATGATVLVVAHRPKTLADSDSLVVMGDGVVLEQGSPQELRSRRGAYVELVGPAAQDPAAEPIDDTVWVSDTI